MFKVNNEKIECVERFLTLANMERITPVFALLNVIQLSVHYC